MISTFICPAFMRNHREQVDEYLHDQERKAGEVREQIEANPVYKSKVDELRKRIKSRYNSQHPAE